MMLSSLDLIVVGAGLAGSVAARRAAEAGLRVLVIEKKNHIGGHCYDYQNEHGVLVHQYGPHIFHTDNERVFGFLSRFTRWYEYQHKVLSHIDGHLVPIPFNLNTLAALFPQSLAQRLEGKLVETFGLGARVPILELREKQDPDLSLLAEFIYEKVFLNYNRKQWGLDPDQIDPRVSARVPISVSRDDRYFANKYQAIPKQGYTRMFSAVLNHPRIHLLLNTDAEEVLQLEDGKVLADGRVFTGKLIYTGAADELFGLREGPLPYRSLDIRFENRDVDRHQEAGVVNHPNNYDFTRITEYKYFMAEGDRIPKTTISREYPQEYERGLNNPYYVVSSPENAERYGRYQALAASYPGLILLGRLAEYRYYDMDQVVLAALEKMDEVLNA